LLRLAWNVRASRRRTHLVAPRVFVFTGKTPINNDVIDVERVAKELTTALPFRHHLNRVPPVIAI